MLEESKCNLRSDRDWSYRLTGSSSARANRASATSRGPELKDVEGWAYLHDLHTRMMWTRLVVLRPRLPAKEFKGSHLLPLLNLLLPLSLRLLFRTSDTWHAATLWLPGISQNGYLFHGVLYEHAGRRRVERRATAASPNDGGSRGHNSRWKQLREGPRMLRCYPRGCFSMSCLDRSADQILYRLCWRNEYVAGCLLIQNMLCPGGRVCVSPFSPSQVGPRNDRPRSQSTKSHDVQGRINACS